MVRCFLTGVQFCLEEAFVLNRREARDLLDALKDRVASLRRVIDQFSPLDDEDDNAAVAHNGRTGFARKKHRLVCKAVADALAPGFPEIRLFLTWPEYHSHARLATLHGLRRHPLFGGEIGVLNDDALRQVEKLGKGVLHLLDPKRVLPQDTRLAIAVGTCVHHRGRSPEEVVRLIRTAAAENGDPDALRITQDHLDAVRNILGIRVNVHPPEQAAVSALSKHENKRHT